MDTACSGQSRARHWSGSVGNLPWLWPGIAASVVLAAVLGRRIGTVLQTGAGVGGLLTASLGMILSATLTPLREGFESGGVARNGCDFSRLAPLSIDQLLTINDASLNVLLFVPLGLAIGLIPRSRIRWIIVAMAVALPIGIELSQLVLTGLRRGCESGDMIDNLTGLFAGWAVIAVMRLVLRFIAAERPGRRAGDA